MKKLIILICLLSGANCFAQYNAGPYASKNPSFYPIPTGSVLVISNSANRAAVGGSQVQNNPAYFADAADNAIAAGLPTADFAGQLLMTYNTGIGGNVAGQLFFAGQDLSWRRDLQLGGVTIYQTTGSANDGLYVKVTNGIDNCITLQNQASNHFSAMRFTDFLGSETGAVGYGNTAALIYPDMDFLESYANGKGFYFVGNGKALGGLERTTGSFVWFDGTTAADTNAVRVAKITQAGVFTNLSDIRAGGIVYAKATHAMTLASGVTDPQNFDPAGVWNTSGGVNVTGSSGVLRVDQGVGGHVGSLTLPAIGLGYGGWMYTNFNIYQVDTFNGQLISALVVPNNGGGSGNIKGTQYMFTNGVSLAVGITSASMGATNVLQIDTLGGAGALLVSTNGNVYMSGTNFAAKGFINGSPTNISSFTLVTTNWISGQLYTNQTGRPIMVSGSVTLTTAGVVGYSQMALQVNGVVTNYSSVLSAIGGLTGTMTNAMSSAIVPNSGVFTWTNTSSGAGDASGTYGGQYIVQ